MARSIEDVYKTCPDCKKELMFLAVANRPDLSEFYCKEEHKSWHIDPENGKLYRRSKE